MKFIKNTKLCFRLILIIVTFNITVIALNYAIGVPQWIIGISLVGIILYTFLLFFSIKANHCSAIFPINGHIAYLYSTIHLVHCLPSIALFS